MEQQQQVNPFPKPAQGQLEKSRNSSSLLSGFNKFLSSRLSLPNHNLSVRNRVQSMFNFQTINLNNNVQTDVQNVAESRRQRQELERILSQRSSLRNQTSNDDDETTDANESTSTSQINIQQQQNVKKLPEVQIMDSVEQNDVVQYQLRTNVQEIQSQFAAEDHNWSDNQIQLMQQQQQQLQDEQDELYRLQVAVEAQELLHSYLASQTHTSSSGNFSGIFMPNQQQKYNQDPP